MQRWIAGEAFPPHEAFLQALDIVAAGPAGGPGRPAGAGARARRAPIRSRLRSGQFRQVQPKDGAPASNKPAQDEKKAKG